MRWLSTTNASRPASVHSRVAQRLPRCTWLADWFSRNFDHGLDGLRRALPDRFSRSGVDRLGIELLHHCGPSFRFVVLALGLLPVSLVVSMSVAALLPDLVGPGADGGFAALLHVVFLECRRPAFSRNTCCAAQQASGQRNVDRTSDWPKHKKAPYRLDQRTSGHMLATFEPVASEVGLVRDADRGLVMHVDTVKMSSAAPPVAGGSACGPTVKGAH